MKKESKQIKQYLQNIVKNIPFENLPTKWQGFDLVTFSKDKTLFDFQKQGLQNALKVLWLYFKDREANKQSSEVVILQQFRFTDSATRNTIVHDPLVQLSRYRGAF